MMSHASDEHPGLTTAEAAHLDHVKVALYVAGFAPHPGCRDYWELEHDDGRLIIIEPDPRRDLAGRLVRMELNAALMSAREGEGWRRHTVTSQRFDARWPASVIRWSREQLGIAAEPQAAGVG